MIGQRFTLDELGDAFGSDVATAFEMGRELQASIDRVGMSLPADATGFEVSTEARGGLGDRVWRPSRRARPAPNGLCCAAAPRFLRASGSACGRPGGDSGARAAGAGESGPALRVVVASRSSSPALRRSRPRRTEHGAIDHSSPEPRSRPDAPRRPSPAPTTRPSRRARGPSQRRPPRNADRARSRRPGAEPSTAKAATRSRRGWRRQIRNGSSGSG